MEPTEKQVKEFIEQAQKEFGLALSVADALQMLREVVSEGARDRR